MRGLLSFAVIADHVLSGCAIGLCVYVCVCMCVCVFVCVQARNSPAPQCS